MVSVSLIADSIFSSDLSLAKNEHILPASKVSGKNSASAANSNSLFTQRFPSKLIYLLNVMLNPWRKISIDRLNTIRKLGWCLITFQLLDGILTYFGLYLFGHDAEGNPLVRMLISNLGVEAGIALCKLLTIFVILLILIAGHKINWLSRALKSLLGIYLLFALLPWSYLIIQALAFNL